MNQTVLIIGAGLGGLATAIRLRLAGYSVTIWEKNSQAGGKMNQILFGGQTFDTGPTVFTWPELLDELFALAGKQRADYVSLIPIDPQFEYYFPWRDTAITVPRKDQGLALEAQGLVTATEWQRYQNLAGNMWQELNDYFFTCPWQPIDMFRPRMALTGWRLRAWDNYQHTVHSIFVGREWRHILNNKAIYLGSVPAQVSPGLLTIPYLEQRLGIWQPQGGLYAVIQALIRLATEIGVKIEYNSDVINLTQTQKNWEAKTKNLSSNFDIVVHNGDLIDLRTRLLGSAWPIKRDFLPSSSAIIWYLPNVKAQNLKSPLAHHSVFFAPEPENEMIEIVTNNYPNEKNHTVYLLNRSASEDNVEGLYVLISVPAIKDQRYWSQGGAERLWIYAYNKVLAPLGISAEQCQPKKVWTPENFVSAYHGYLGSIFSLASNFWQSAFFRPFNRTPLKGLYLVGGGTQPGGGIPLVQLSAKFTTDLIMKDYPVQD